MRLRNYDNERGAGCKRGAGGEQEDEGKSYFSPGNNLTVVITGLLRRMTSISLVSDSASTRLSQNSFAWQLGTGEDKLEMIPRAPN